MKRRSRSWFLILAVGLAVTGCGITRPGVPIVGAPKELDKAIYPEYRIEPPDVLDIVGIHIVPKAPYKMRTGDTLIISVIGTLPEEPIQGEYAIQIGGGVNLGFQYGVVPNISGKTVEEIEPLILKHLQEYLRAPEVTVSLGQIASQEQISGARQVIQDGTISLGSYGTVSVVGKTAEEARTAIEEKLSEKLEDPEISVTVSGFNSKFYYVITQGAGFGDQIIRQPTTGNETVLDAIAGLGGLQRISAEKIWVARPGRSLKEPDKILKVDYRAMTQLADTTTNYQLLPGDRLYIAENKVQRFSSDVQTFTQPFRVISSFATQGASTVSRFSGNVLRGGSFPQAFNATDNTNVIVNPNP